MPSAVGQRVQQPLLHTISVWKQKTKHWLLQHKPGKVNGMHSSILLCQLILLHGLLSKWKPQLSTY